MCCKRSTIICFQLSINNYRLSVLHFRLTIIGYQLSFLGFQLSFNNDQLSVQLLSDLDPPKFRPLPSDWNTSPLFDSDKICYVDLFWDVTRYVCIF